MAVTFESSVYHAARRRWTNLYKILSTFDTNLST
jgi:hypothetical protein